LQRLYPGSVVKDSAKSVLVPRPVNGISSEPVKDTDLLHWSSALISEIFSNT
jgi:hypothetical protein